MNLLNQEEEELDDIQKLKKENEANKKAFQKLKEEKLEQMLEFSSEIEYDDRFHPDELTKKLYQVSNELLVNRSVPESIRDGAKAQRQENRYKLFDEYKRQVADHNYNVKKVQFTEETIAEYYKNNPSNLKKDLLMEKEIMAQIEREKYQVRIGEFIKEKYLYLPRNKTDNLYRLLNHLKEDSYQQKVKRDGLKPLSIVLMNEERRKKLNLPPLSAIDYNAMERACQKIKLLIDCLMLQRRMNGFTLLPKDLVITQMCYQQQKRTERMRKLSVKQNKINHKLFQIYGEHIDIPLEFNSEAANVKSSMLKIEEYQRQNLMIPPLLAVDGSADNITNVIREQLELEDQMNQPTIASNQATDGMHMRRLGYKIFDPDLIDFDRRYGSIEPPLPGEMAQKKVGMGQRIQTLEMPEEQMDRVAFRHARIMNEYESYIQDQMILDQQVIKLSDEQTNSKNLNFIQITQVRKIKSNVENIMQILWQRESDVKQSQDLKNLIFSAEDDDMLVFKDDDFREFEILKHIKERAQETIGEMLITIKRDKEDEVYGAKSNPVMQQPPKIERLKSKICKIISDHEDVQDYDRLNYQGNGKIPSHMLLDLTQEFLGKQRTRFKSYVEIFICSPLNRRRMWEDSINLPWETFIDFFKQFHIKWDPIQFMKRGSFT